MTKPDFFTGSSAARPRKPKALVVNANTSSMTLFNFCNTRLECSSDKSLGGGVGGLFCKFVVGKGLNKAKKGLSSVGVDGSFDASMFDSNLKLNQKINSLAVKKCCVIVIEHF